MGIRPGIRCHQPGRAAQRGQEAAVGERRHDDLVRLDAHVCRHGRRQPPHAADHLAVAQTRSRAPAPARSGAPSSGRSCRRRPPPSRPSRRPHPLRHIARPLGRLHRVVDHRVGGGRALREQRIDAPDTGISSRWANGLGVTATMGHGGRKLRDGARGLARYGRRDDRRRAQVNGRLHRRVRHRLGERAARLGDQRAGRTAQPAPAPRLRRCAPSSAPPPADTCPTRSRPRA